MKTIIHKADTRGHFDHGWLKTVHTFSFAGYFDRNRMNFGLLRVLNDDVVEPAEGFGTHPHDNMEIVTVPLEGALEHKDSMGHIEVLKPDEIQIMSAGSGITHSEYNASKSAPVSLLQIWIYPKEKNIKPRYDQRIFDKDGRKNKIQLLVSPDKSNHTLWINQDAYFSRCSLDANKEIAYKLNKSGNGVYIFLISGNINIERDELNSRDGIGIWEAEEIKIFSESSSEILLIETPMR
jgi:redox-sensitive bicupin YhaK (pirin superfamily)